MYKFLMILGLMFGGGNLVLAQVLVSGSGVVLTAQDMQADLQRVPPEARAATFSRPEAVHANATGLFVRRVLAAEAIQAGLDKDETIRLALELARDRVLAEARLAQLDATNQPNPKAAEAYAESTYKANPSRFGVGEQVRIRHILVRLDEPNAKQVAEQILEELKAGASFEELAKARSKDPGSAAKGGDLGLVTRGRMVKPFEDAAFKLGKAGELSEVVESNFGYHIIRLDERIPAGAKSFADVKEQLVKEAQSTVVNNGRAKTQDHILASAKFDTDAIAAFARSQRK